MGRCPEWQHSRKPHGKKKMRPMWVRSRSQSSRARKRPSMPAGKFCLHRRLCLVFMVILAKHFQKQWLGFNCSTHPTHRHTLSALLTSGPLWGQKFCSCCCVQPQTSSVRWCNPALITAGAHVGPVPLKHRTRASDGGSHKNHQSAEREGQSSACQVRIQEKSPLSSSNMAASC